jgi:hypothetical protein
VSDAGSSRGQVHLMDDAEAGLARPCDHGTVNKVAGRGVASTRAHAMETPTCTSNAERCT